MYYSTCDLGTDCTDCGPWTLPQGTDEQALHWHPVADIRAKDVSWRGLGWIGRVSGCGQSAAGEARGGVPLYSW